jgi:hypothetical protein
MSLYDRLAYYLVLWRGLAFRGWELVRFGLSAEPLVILFSENTEWNMGYDTGYGASQHHEKDVWRFCVL